ncbi:hypothetical protein [Nocardioides montaniterrae]
MSDEYPSYPPPEEPPPGQQPHGEQPYRQHPYAQGDYQALPPERGSRKGYLLGAIVGAPALLFALGMLTSLVTSISPSSGSAATGIIPLLGFGVPIGLLFNARTRPWGVGILIGYAVLMIVAAGACVLLFALFVHGEASN